MDSVQHISWFAAFTAGLLSFVSPCVLPLVPSYISYITGLSVEQLADAEERVRYRREIIVNALIFIAGFSSVFIAFGASASLIGQALMTQSPWQPALYLLSAEGAQLRSGSVHRAGVAAVLPTILEPGTYYLVVDSSVREWSRGDGLYRLYVGWNRSLLGSMEMGRLGGD